MSRRILFFQSKVALAIIGAVLIGGGAALMASASFSATPNQSSTNQSQNYVNVPTSGGSAPSSATTPTTSASGTTPSPTSTPGKSPTATPTRRPPTPTPTPKNGQAGTINGTVTSVDTTANQFTVRMISGALKTVFVNSQTTFQGACTSLSGLHTGWDVVVQGVYQGSALLATDVNSDN
jgi:cytoskeletal protein RodZ